MNVLILTEGGRDKGLGHITRCTSIREAFEAFGIQAQLIVDGDETVRDLLEEGKARVFDWLRGRDSLPATIAQADIVFVDSYGADEDLYEMVSRTAGTAVYFDDTMRVNYPKGFVLNGAVLAEQMPYPQREGVTYLLGTRYTPLRKEFWDVPAKPIRDDIESVMVTFGGSDMHDLTAQVLKLLVESYPTWVKKVIIARSLRDTAAIESAVDDKTELVYHPDAARMREVMLESDVAISAGGQTLYELARVGVPTIGICVAANQLQNIEGWRKSGFLEYVGQHKDGDLLENTQEAVNRLLPHEARNTLSQRGQMCVDGNGSLRIARKLLKVFG